MQADTDFAGKYSLRLRLQHNLLFEAPMKGAAVSKFTRCIIIVIIIITFIACQIIQWWKPWHLTTVQEMTSSVMNCYFSYSLIISSCIQSWPQKNIHWEIHNHYYNYYYLLLFIIITHLLSVISNGQASIDGVERSWVKDMLKVLQSTQRRWLEPMLSMLHSERSNQQATTSHKR